MSRHIPAQISVPSSPKFTELIMNKFTGLNDKHNVLNTDPQSFSQASNLYVDDNEVLTTRPALKSFKNNIKDVHYVRDWLITVNNDNVITLENNGVQHSSSFDYTILNIVEYNDYLVFICKEGIVPFDKNRNVFVDIHSVAHLATEETVINGRVSNIGASSANLLNNKYHREYVYSKDSFINNNQLLNKTVTIKYDDVVMTDVIYKKHTLDTLLFDIGYTETDVQYQVATAEGIKPVILKTIDNVVYAGDNNNLFVAIRNLKDSSIYKIALSQDGLYMFWFNEVGLFKMSIADRSVTVLHQWDKATLGDLESIIDVFALHGNRFAAIVKTDTKYYMVGTNITDGTVLVQELTDGNIYKYVRLSNSGFVITTEQASGTGLIMLYDNTFTLVTSIDTLSSVNNIKVTDFKVEIIDNLDLIYLVGIVNDNTIMYSSFTFGQVVLGDLVFVDLNTTDAEFVTGQSNTSEFRFLSNTTYFADSAYQLNNFVKPIFVGDAIYAMQDNKLYSNILDNNIVSVTETIERDSFTTLTFETVTSFDNKHFLTSGNTIFVTSNNVDNDVDLFYIPEVLKLKLDQDTITGVAVVGDQMLGVFFKDKLYYCAKTEILVNNEYLYTYEKSKLTTGCTYGNNPLTTTLGDKVVYVSNEGLQTLTYLDFTATSDKQTELLSYIIDNTFRSWVKGKVIKLTFWKFWLLCYSQNDNVIYLLDMRTNSWWKWEMPLNVTKILTNDTDLQILISNGVLCDMDFNLVKDFNNIPINWKLVTQKLHLNAPNNYKRVNVINYNIQKEIFGDTTFLVKYLCYRKILNETINKTELMSIDKTSTYVSRINFAKVNEFQFELSADLLNQDVDKISFSAITIKYVVGGAIR